jgi:RNA polymerase sigma-70 factor (ECF subfamily)
MSVVTESATGDRSESEMVRLAQQGDSAAFEVLYQRHSRRVYALCLRMAGNTTEAEDLTQDAFLTIFRKIQGFRGESAFSTWVHRVTVNIVLMRFRKKRVGEEPLDEVGGPGDKDQGAPFELGERDLRLTGVIDRVNLERAIDQLAPGCKKMFILHDVAGYRHEEIAEIAGCSVGNSKSQVHKARSRLRQILREGLRGSEKGRVPTPSARRRRASERAHRGKAVGVLPDCDLAYEGSSAG